MVDLPSSRDALVTTNTVASRIDAAAMKLTRSGTKASELEAGTSEESDRGSPLDRAQASKGSARGPTIADTAPPPDRTQPVVQPPAQSRLRYPEGKSEQEGHDGIP